MQDGLVGIHEFHLDAGDEGTVYPFLGGNAAGPVDDSTEIALGETQARGIIGQLMLLMAMLIDKLNKPVENGLFA